MTNTDKRARADLFRTRLVVAMAERGLSQSALARAIAVDRSTLSQLLSDQGARLPNAQVVGECAAELRVSADWLLGLSERPESAADLMNFNMSITKAPRTLVDNQIAGWHKEARGYKIRHVPAGLPDLLKTRAVLEWEYLPQLGRTTAQAIGASEDRLRYMRQSGSDYEIAFPLHEIGCFARGQGYYADLPVSARLAQIDQVLDLYSDLFPTLRIFLYDARRVYSAPSTVFGPLLAVLYLGSNYIAFRDSERVKMLGAQFDGLVREAAVTDRDFVGYLRALRGELI